MTRWERRTHRERQARIRTVGGAAVFAITLAIVVAACAVSVNSADRARGARGPTASITDVLQTRTVQAVSTAVRELPVTTTTTTRPAVNPDTGPPPPDTGTGRRIVYCNSCQKVWLVEADEYVTMMFSVSGQRGTPKPGTYHVFRKLDEGRSKANPDLRLPWFVGFTWGPTTDIGFHGIPLRPDDSQIQSDTQLGVPLSSGCIREHQVTAKFLYDWTPMDTTVVVTA